MNEEATEKVVISELSIPKEGARRNSTGKTDTRVSPRLNSDEKHLPNYLRASTGSCHDFCKYGRKHEFEAKGRRTVLPTFLSNKDTPEEHSQVKVPTLRERRKRPGLKLKQAKNEHSDESKVIKQKGPSSATTDTPSTPEGSSEKLSIVSPTNQAEGPSEEPVSIKLMISSTIFGSEEHAQANLESHSEELRATTLDIPSPTYNEIISAGETSLTWVEGSSEAPLSMKHMTPSTIQEVIVPAEYTSASPGEVLLEEPISVELVTPSPVHQSNISAKHSMADGGEQSSSGTVSMETKNPLSIENGILSSKRAPANRSEASSKGYVNRKLKTPLVQKSIVPAKQKPLRKAEESPKGQNQVKSSGIRDRNKGQVSKLKITTQTKTEVSERPKVIGRKKVDVSGEHDNIKQKTSLPVKKIIRSVEPKLTKQKSIFSLKKTITSALPRITKQKGASPTHKIEVYAKPTNSLKSKTALVNPTSPMIYSESLASRRRYQENRLTRSAGLSETGGEKIMKPLRASLPPKPHINRISSVKLRKFRNSKPPSPLKNQAKAENGDGGEIVKEKTLYVIEPIKRKPRKFESSMSSSSSSSESGEVIGSNIVKKGKGCNKPADASKGESKRTPKRTTTFKSEDKHPSPHKLKFRRGKVVNLQPENNGPRTLKFRQSRSLSENQGEAGKRSFKKKRESSGADSSPAILAAPTVVLRHQDPQDKKGTQGLFNHVIEETASKLVEARKSKVKALVSAFETVISLQESKVASNV